MKMNEEAAPITHAMVAAAGFGKRMLPITETLPKPMVEVGGMSLIERGLDALSKAGVEQAVVNVHHLADKLEAHVSGISRPEIIISDERDEILETGGGTLKALPHLGTAPFFYLNADSIWIEDGIPNFHRLANAWKDEQMDILLLLSRTDNAVGFSGKGDFFLEGTGDTGRLRRRGDAKSAPYTYASAAIFHPRIFDGVKPSAFSMNVLFDVAREKGRLFGTVMGGVWLHVGTPEAIPLAEAALAESREPV